MPGRDSHLGPVARDHLGRVGLDLASAIETPHDQPHACCCGIAKRHRRAAIPVHHAILLPGRLLFGVDEDASKGRRQLTGVVDLLVH
jgi:hypothetical protein